MDDVRDAGETWMKRFLARERWRDVRFDRVSWRDFFRAIRGAEWREDDVFWGPDVQVSRFVRGEEEIFVRMGANGTIDVSGAEAEVQRQVAELQEGILGIDHSEVVLYAGAGAGSEGGIEEVELEYAVVFAMAELSEIRLVRGIAREFSGFSTAELVAMARADGMRLRVGGLTMPRARGYVEEAGKVGITTSIVEDGGDGEGEGVI